MGWKRHFMDLSIHCRQMTTGLSFIQLHSMTMMKAIGGGFVYRGSRIPALQGSYVFTELVLGRVFYFDTRDLDAGHPSQIKELTILSNGSELNLLDSAGYPNTYTPGNRVDLRLGRDADGELYLLTKGDGWVRKLVPVK